jgi:hypothetical protein
VSLDGQNFLQPRVFTKQDIGIVCLSGHVVLFKKIKFFCFKLFFDVFGLF